MSTLKGNNSCTTYNFKGSGLWCLMPLSTIFQLYLSGIILESKLEMCKSSIVIYSDCVLILKTKFKHVKIYLFYFSVISENILIMIFSLCYHICISLIKMFTDELKKLHYRNVGEGLL